MLEEFGFKIAEMLTGAMLLTVAGFLYRLGTRMQTVESSYVPKIGTNDEPGFQALRDRVQVLEISSEQRDSPSRAEFEASRNESKAAHERMLDALAGVQKQIEVLTSKIEVGLKDREADTRLHTEILAAIKSLHPENQRSSGWFRS